MVMVRQVKLEALLEKFGEGCLQRAGAERGNTLRNGVTEVLLTRRGYPMHKDAFLKQKSEQIHETKRHEKVFQKLAPGFMGKINVQIKKTSDP